MVVRARGSLNYRDPMVLKGGGRGSDEARRHTLSAGAARSLPWRRVTRFKHSDRVIGTFHRAGLRTLSADYLTEGLAPT